MIDSEAAHLALRNRLLGTSVATTGSTSLAATALGFSRASGSFITDGFRRGMEVVGTGFSSANNTASVITQVTAQFLTISGGRTAQASTAGRTLAVSVPTGRSWENVEFSPTTGFPYISEQFVPAPGRLIGVADGGTLEQTGLYVITYFGLADTDYGAIRRVMDAWAAKYTPGTSLTVGSDALRIRGDTSVWAGQIIPLDNGYASCQLTVPWRAWTASTIAA